MELARLACLERPGREPTVVCAHGYCQSSAYWAPTPAGTPRRARKVEHGAAMRDRIPGARLEVLEHSGHTPQLEEPDAFHAVALPFLLGRA